MRTKWSDCFKIGKYKNQEVKRICYLCPSYIEWCLKNWDGFKLTKHEHTYKVGEENYHKT